MFSEPASVSSGFLKPPSSTGFSADAFSTAPEEPPSSFSSSTSFKFATSQRGLGEARQHPELQPPMFNSDSSSSSSSPVEDEEEDEELDAEVLSGERSSPLVESGNL